MKKNNEEPVICSKWNKTFENDSEYLRHYDEKHKTENL